MASNLITTLSDAIGYLDTLYNVSAAAPSPGDEDYIVWTSLFNIAINLWEVEEDMWKELFVHLADAATGDKTTSSTKWIYNCPDDFNYPLSAYIWLGDGINKTAYQIIEPQEAQLHAKDRGRWCYFLRNRTLNFNPNLLLPDGATISYDYYKNANKMVNPTDVIEMNDPMFCVYYALSELKKDEGDATASSIATQKLDGMVDMNETPAWFQSNNLLNKTEMGMGVTNGIW